MNTQADLISRLQGLLTIWDEQAASAARKLEQSENPIARGFYTARCLVMSLC